MKSHEVIDVLRKSYGPPAWALLEQVGDSTGVYTSRHADAIAMSLWPSRGLTLHGFEIKVSRGDWKRELANPGKAEPIAEYCDFWAVGAPTGVVPQLEVPTTWGLLEIDDKGRLKTVKKAEPLTPKPIDRGFLAAILRKASETSPTFEMRAAARAAAIEEAVKHVQQLVDRQTSPLRRELDALRERVQTFEAELGVPLEWVRGRYGMPIEGAELARIVRHIAASNARDLTLQADHLDRIAERIREAAGELRETLPTGPAGAA